MFDNYACQDTPIRHLFVTFHSSEIIITNAITLTLEGLLHAFIAIMATVKLMKVTSNLHRYAMLCFASVVSSISDFIVNDYESHVVIQLV